MPTGVVAFKLLDKKADPNSVFVNEDGTKDTTKQIDFTNRYGVLNPYYIIIDGKRETRQFIRGCSFFEPDRQKKEFYIPDISNSVVEFKAGGDIIADADTDRIFIEWIKDHPNNTKSKYHDPAKHDAMFYTYDPKEAKKQVFDKATDEDEAMEIVISLRNDPARLRAVASLFETTDSMYDESEIYVELRRLARENPGNFKESIGNREKAVLADVRIAKKYTVINKDAKGYFYEGTQGTILETTEKKDSVSDMQLVKFLMSKEGREHYKQIQIGISIKELEMSAPTGILEGAEEKK